MKLTGMTMMAALMLASCSRPANHETAKATPAPVEIPAKPTPAPIAVAPQFAPEGIFYLIVSAKVETDSGVVGLKPGTGVKRLRPGVYLTPAGEQPLADDQVTNDLAVAQAARDGEAATAAAAQRRIAAIGAKAAAMATPLPVNAPARALDPRIQLQIQYSLNQIELKRLRAQLNSLGSPRMSPGALAAEKQIDALREANRRIIEQQILLR